MKKSLKNIEIHLLALRDAADSALMELEHLKAETPQADQKHLDLVALQLSRLNSKSLGKRTNKKN